MKTVTLERIGGFVLRFSLVILLLLFGALKWTTAEAKGIEPLIANSPLFAWMLRVMSLQLASEAIGIVELAIAVTIALRPWAPRVTAIGSAVAAAMFLGTLSFLLTTPNVGPSAPFLLKDLTLLGAALWSAGEALRVLGYPEVSGAPGRYHGSTSP